MCQEGRAQDGEEKALQKQQTGRYLLVISGVSLHCMALLFLGTDKPVCAAGDQPGDKGQQPQSTKASPWPFLEFRAQHPGAAGKQRSHLGESHHPTHCFLG